MVRSRINTSAVQANTCSAGRVSFMGAAEKASGELQLASCLNIPIHYFCYYYYEFVVVAILLHSQSCGLVWPSITWQSFTLHYCCLAVLPQDLLCNRLCKHRKKKRGMPAPGRWGKCKCQLSDSRYRWTGEHEKMETRVVNSRVKIQSTALGFAIYPFPPGLNFHRLHLSPVPT